jgi:hypothetical protein
LTALRAGAPGIPVVALGERQGPESLTLPKQEAQLSFELLDSAGDRLVDELEAQLAAEVDSLDIGLKAYLSIRTGRSGLVAGEIIAALNKRLTDSAWHLGEGWEAGLALEKIAYHMFQKPLIPGKPGIDIFSVTYALVLAKKPTAEGETEAEGARQG